MRILKKILYVLWVIIWWVVKAPFVFAVLVVKEHQKPENIARRQQEWEYVDAENRRRAEAASIDAQRHREENSTYY